MPLKSLDNLYLILGFLVPGLIALFVRSQFVTGRRPPHAAAILSYLTVSVIYYAMALPFVGSVLSIQEPGYEKALAWFALTFVGPAVLGLLLGVNIQKDLFRRVLQRCGLNPVHVIPTAWDWKFGVMKEQWVLVTLKDGTRFAGFCGNDSFMSSDPAERDIYIQWIYDIDDNNNWSQRGENGVLIAAGEISTIEFWPTILRRIPMSKNDKPTPSRSLKQRGYQPKKFTEGYKPRPQGGHQPTSQSEPTKPPSNPPNQGSGGKK